MARTGQISRCGVCRRDRRARWPLGEVRRCPTADARQLDARGSDDVHDQFDISLEDSDLLGEVELTTNLIIAASESDEHLSVDEIDQILGVVPAPRSEA